MKQGVCPQDKISVAGKPLKGAGMEPQPVHRLLSPLDLESRDVRFVILHAGQPSERLVCTVVTRPIQDCEYEALSYTWGNACQNPELPEDEDDSENGSWIDTESPVDEEDPKSNDDQLNVGAANVLVQATLNGASVNVMQNLGDALYHLRRKEQDRTLWIDYICIDQENVVERNAQVQRMGEIYSYASRVVIWLGLPGGDSGRALDDVLLLTKNVHFTELGLLGSHKEVRVRNERLMPLLSLLSRSWFERIWVVQEVVLAREAIVQVGARLLPWESFLAAAKAYCAHLSCCSEYIQQLLGYHHNSRYLELRQRWLNILALGSNLRSLPLLTLLRVFYSRLASDPRDKVYGILELLAPIERIVIPDYALSASEVYQQAAVAIINHSKDLALLIGKDEYPGSVDCPSWCPDLTTGTVSGLDEYDRYNAAGAIPTTVRLYTKNVLTLKGLFVDTVTDVVDEVRDKDNLVEAYQNLCKWEAMVGLPKRPLTSAAYCIDGARNDSFWRTVLMDLSADREHRIHDGEYHAAAYNSWRAWLEEYSQLNSSIKRRAYLRASEAADSNIRNHNTVLLSYPFCRWFFTTTVYGLMGLGPVDMEPGDHVCILRGGKTPFVLREVTDRIMVDEVQLTCYKLMGYAYVHGIMDGESLEDVGAGDDDWADIYLC